MDATTGPQIIEHISQSLNYTPYDSRWIPCSARFSVVGCYPRGTGIIEIYGFDSTHSKLKSLYSSEKKDGIKCSTYGASLYEKRQLATGDYKGNLNVYDIENIDKPLFSQQGHSSIINAIDGVGGLNIGYGAPEIVTGGRDGCVKVWDIRTPDPVASLEPSSSSMARDCWAVAFGDSHSDNDRVVVAGYDNGDIKLLSLRMQKLLWETNVKNGVVNIQFDRKDIAMNKLIITTLESKFRLYDMRTKHINDGYNYLTEKAHKSTVWTVRHLPQNRDIFATTGGNGTINLYRYEYPSQRSIKDQDGNEKGVMGKLIELNNKKLSDQPIIGWDWSNEKLGLAVATCLDQTIKVAIVTKLANA